MKKALTVLLWCFLVVFCGLIFYHSFGWFRGDVAEYIKENYKPDGTEITSCEYLQGGQDKDGGYCIYQVITENGAKHYIRLNIVYHRYVTRIGPDFKILGITELPPAEVVTQPADTDKAHLPSN
jgi:hypothetical protein